MAYRSTPTRFYLGYVPATTTSEIYEVTTDGAVLTHISFYNNYNLSETIELWIVPSGESVGDEYKITQGTLASETSEDLSPIKGIILENGDKIYAKTTTASQVSLLICGAILEDI